jgi:hypothetical protein
MASGFDDLARGREMPQRIADFGLRVGQRYQEMRKAARQWEVESFYTDSRAVPHVCLRDILDPSRRVILVRSALMDRSRFRPLEVRLRRSI